MSFGFIFTFRLREPAFDQAIELHERERWVLHPSVREAVDAYYSGEPHKVTNNQGVMRFTKGWADK